MTWLLTSRLGRALSAVVAGVIAILTFGAVKKKQGRTEAQTDALRDSAKRQEKGREAVKDLRGADRDTLIDRLRRNDGRWD